MNPTADAATPPQGGITESDIANYLVNTPGFFERHAELLSAVQLASPHGTRAVSLQERQMEMLREKIRGLEHRIIEMIRHGQENVSIADRLHRFTREIMLVRYPGNLPDVVVGTLRHEFLVPQVALRLWGLDDAYDDHPARTGLDDAGRAQAAALHAPWVGPAGGIELARTAAGWVEEGHRMQSVALLPLVGPAPAAGGEGRPFGVMLLGSPDPTRYVADMGTDFLVRIADIAGAGLSRMLPLG